MLSLCFATNNTNKIAEISGILGSSFRILSLKEIGCEEELPENQDTIEDNSLEKASYVFEHYGQPCFADDTGLEVKVLDGEPGVLSARYAGDQKNSDDNIDLLLKHLDGTDDRSARFKTIITLVTTAGIVQFEGIVEGNITRERKGSMGFGYDPVFIPQGYRKTFAEMSMQEKNRISHRGLAIQKFADYLRSHELV